MIYIIFYGIENDILLWIQVVIASFDYEHERSSLKYLSDDLLDNQSYIW